MADQARHPVPFPAPAPLVGRERELAILRAALAAALAARGSLVLIGGEAGIGKTALAETVCSEARARGALILVGRCYDLAETPPYGPWAAALAGAPPARELPPPPDLGGAAAASQATLLASVRASLAALATRQPLVILLDDLHWADPASLDLLRAVVRDLAGLPLLLLATYRDDELTRRHPLYALLPLLVREARAARVDPLPLDPPALLDLVRTRYTLPGGDEARLVAYLTSTARISITARARWSRSAGCLRPRRCGASSSLVSCLPFSSRRVPACGCGCRQQAAGCGRSQPCRHLRRAVRG